MSHYQGHLSDGSSIQKHSAGGLYPYVVYAQQQGEKMRWGYIAPDGTSRLVADTYSQACDCALAHKENVARAKAFAAGREFCLLACHVELPEPVAHKNSHWFEHRDFPEFGPAQLAAQHARIDAMRRR